MASSRPSHGDNRIISSRFVLKALGAQISIRAAKPEGRDHIIKCPHPTKRNKWRHGLLTALLDTCSAQLTYGPLLNLLREALREWMYQHIRPETDFTVNCQSYPQELHWLIRQQNQNNCSKADLVANGAAFKAIFIIDHVLTGKGTTTSLMVLVRR